MYTFRYTPPMPSPPLSVNVIKDQSVDMPGFKMFFKEKIDKKGSPVAHHYHGLYIDHTPQKPEDIREVCLKDARASIKYLFKKMKVNLVGNKMYQLKAIKKDDLHKVLRYFHKGYLMNPIAKIHLPPENLSEYVVNCNNPSESRQFCTQYWETFMVLKKKVNFQNSKAKMIEYIKDTIPKQLYTDYDFEKIIAEELMIYYQVNTLTLNRFQFMSNVQTIANALSKEFMGSSEAYGQCKISQWLIKYD